MLKSADFMKMSFDKLKMPLFKVSRTLHLCDGGCIVDYIYSTCTILP